jgi:hypothetical protein
MYYKTVPFSYQIKLTLTHLSKTNPPKMPPVTWRGRCWTKGQKAPKNYELMQEYDGA